MSALSYQEFIDCKKSAHHESGFCIDDGSINQILFPFQRHIVKWAVGKGKAAIFAGTGLGKSFMQIEWARIIYELTGGDVLLLTPPAVSSQTIMEGKKLGVKITRCRSQEDCKPGLNITNYERLHLFDASHFVAVVLDESSILKSYAGKTKHKIINGFSNTPYKLACTATPSPNDYLELGNHCEFLDVMRSNEMISRYFINDTMQAGVYRLKHHARDVYWRWVASWAVSLTMPSDLGFSDEGYILKPLNVDMKILSTDGLPAVDGELFRDASLSATSLHREKRLTAPMRAEYIASLVNNSSDTWLIWAQTNYEADELSKLIPDATEVRGSDSLEVKEERLDSFSSGESRVLITKASLAGFGLNWQHCNHIAFVGLGYSYEEYYQAIRRCWRFGQENEVNVFIASTDSEGSIIETINRKESEHKTMQVEMSQAIGNVHAENNENNDLMPEHVSGDTWDMYLGDCVQQSCHVESGCIGFSVYSPPFSNLYIYSDSIYDLGNSASDEEFFEHYRYLARELLRVTRPGRLTAIHCKDLPLYKGRDGAAGLRDFPGQIIRMYEEEGWTYHSRVTIWKDPVTEMQRTKNHGLLYKQLCKDSAASRQGMADYLIVMRKWGNEEEWEPVTRGGERFFDYVGSTMHEPAAKEIARGRNDIERQRLYSIAVWQRYASPVWFDVQQTNVLNIQQARDQNDEKHICPLQLDIIERAVELWSNPGDLVFSPFAGIGSEGYVAVKMGRKFIGIELKPSYFNVAIKNLGIAHQQQDDLFAQI